jgi:hypothetical protein
MAMKLKRAPVEIFNLAFLDIISCAFGAVVMLILLAKNGDEGQFNDQNQISTLIQAVTKAQSGIGLLTNSLSDKEDSLKKLLDISAVNQSEEDALGEDILRAKSTLQKLTGAASGLMETKKNIQRAAVAKGKSKFRDAEAGGIPVDSDYVIFIIDTSGSMRQYWPKVIKTVGDVLNNHPQVKGFQVLSDNGEHLIKASKGNWRKDSPRQRAAILRALKSWTGMSNSSPIEGIETALSIYGKQSTSLALYVFGDDFTGNSFDRAVDKVNRLNSKGSGKKYARIHGIAFPTRSPTLWKFPRVMREITRQNNGTLITII